MASLADPSRSLISAAVGFRHVLEAVLGFLERVTSTHERDPVLLLVLVVLLALPTLVAYLLLAVVVFVVSVAAAGYTRIVERGDVTPELEQAAAAQSAAMLRWLGNLAIKLALALAVVFLILGLVLYMIGNVILVARN